MARSFYDQFKLGALGIVLYVDPDRALYQKMGLVARVVRPPSCGYLCAAICRALWQGVSLCWWPCCAGDVTQQGGAFVIDADGRVLFRHIEQRPGDHADMRELMAAGGVRV
jgi:hypothetical protein